MMGLIMAAALAATTVTAPGPNGPLEGTFIDAGKGAPVVVIIPGSGPTNRDGNNALGIKPNSYKLLAEALGAKGISTIRIDKRGMFGSKAAIPDPNKVTIADYAADAHQWASVAKARTSARCAWLLGHSEGGLVALTAGQDVKDVCGVIAVSSMGRPFGTVLREQLRANPANAPILAKAEKVLDELEAGRRVPGETMTPVLMSLFRPDVQSYLMDLMSKDSAKLAASLKLPLLVVSGDRDIQTPVVDAKALGAAQPKAEVVIAEGVTHTLKVAAGADRAANLATYTDPTLPIAPVVVDSIADFVKAKR